MTSRPITKPRGTSRLSPISHHFAPLFCDFTLIEISLSLSRSRLFGSINRDVIRPVARISSSSRNFPRIPPSSILPQSLSLREDSYWECTWPRVVRGFGNGNESLSSEQCELFIPKKSSESRIFAQPFLNFVVFFKNSIVRIYEKKNLISLHVTF